MSAHSQCPRCEHKAGTSFFTQGCIPWHKCRKCGGISCSNCQNRPLASTSEPTALLLE